MSYSLLEVFSGIVLTVVAHRLELFGGDGWWTGSDGSYATKVRKNCVAAGIVTWFGGQTAKEIVYSFLGLERQP